MKHQGKSIYLVGKAGDEAIVPFQFTNKFGETTTWALKLNTNYIVGENDENGIQITDECYELYSTCDLNNKRIKTKAEERRDLSAPQEGKITNRIGFID